jgi:hypothetical protein
MGLPEKVMDDFNASADTIEAGLSTPEQKPGVPERFSSVEWGCQLNDSGQSRTRPTRRVQQYQAQELDAATVDEQPESSPIVERRQSARSS